MRHIHRITADQDTRHGIFFRSFALYKNRPSTAKKYRTSRLGAKPVANQRETFAKLARKKREMIARNIIRYF
jgi:hypothetical protein